MKKLLISIVSALIAVGAYAASPGVPTLDELAADWQEVGTLRNFPSVNNFAGALQSTPNLTAFGNLTFPPYAEGGWAAQLLLEGKLLKATESRWLPYEVRRRVTVNGVAMESVVRMPFEQQGVLTRLTLENKTSEPRTVNLGMSAYSRIRLYAPEQWRTWGTPRPNDGEFAATVAGQNLTVADKKSVAFSAFSFVTPPTEMKANGEKGDILWRISLPPGKTATIEYAYAIGKDAPAVTTAAAAWAAQFNREFDAAKAKWEERWQAAFQPGNPHFSGHLPTLVTDDAKIRRVYYESALIPLLLCRTTLPAAERCYVTASPEWATTLMYFWDTEMWANAWAMLDPKSMRQTLETWLTLDLHGNVYALDCVSKMGGEKWYAANDWSVFRCLEAYLNVTGDRAFLGQKIKDRTVLEHLVRLATAHREFTNEKAHQCRYCVNELKAEKNLQLAYMPSVLADYGKNTHMLECAPAYEHRVPSLNAANVYMLRRASDFLAGEGEATRAAQLRADADKLREAVLALYVPGEGVWRAMTLDGKKVQLRHCFDYIMTGQALEHDLTPAMKSEMTAFVKRELLTATWMRAMSLQDPAAADSDRPDHGPMGSYDGWPPLTIDVMCRFGQFTDAIAFLRAVEPVTHEGPFSQAHEFLGPDAREKTPVVRIAHRGGQDFNEGCGTAFAEVIIRSVFGYRPDLPGSLLAPAAPRGLTGKLQHIPSRGKLMTITSGETGLILSEE